MKGLIAVVSLCLFTAPVFAEDATWHCFFYTKNSAGNMLSSSFKSINFSWEKKAVYWVDYAIGTEQVRAAIDVTRPNRAAWAWIAYDNVRNKKQRTANSSLTPEGVGVSYDHISAMLDIDAVEIGNDVATQLVTACEAVRPN